MKIHLVALIVPLALLTGCFGRTPSNITSFKTTVLGLDVSQSPGTGMTPAFRLGLVRSYYQSIPTSTNGTIHAPEFVSSVTADVGLTKQRVSEDFASGARGVAGLTNIIQTGYGSMTNRVD